MHIVTEALKKYTSKNYYVVFIDNILIYLDSEADHRRYVYAIINTLQIYNFKLKN
jgi:KaiC/GvpD/RAD55 family RecA-like ATPase